MTSVHGCLFLTTSVELVSYFFSNFHVYLMKTSLFFNISKGRILNDTFLFLYHLDLYTMQEPSYLGKIVLVST